MIIIICTSSPDVSCILWRPRCGAGTGEKWLKRSRVHVLTNHTISSWWPEWPLTGVRRGLNTFWSLQWSFQCPTGTAAYLKTRGDHTLTQGCDCRPKREWRKEKGISRAPKERDLIYPRRLHVNQEESHRAVAQDGVSVICEHVCICGRDGKYSSHSEHTLAYTQLCHSVFTQWRFLFHVNLRYASSEEAQ